MTNGEYLYSFDCKNWQEFDKECYSFDEAKKLAKEKFKEHPCYTSCYVGIADVLSLADVVHNCFDNYAGAIVHNIKGNFQDMYHDFNYLENVSDEAVYQLDEMIKSTIINWLVMHYYVPNTFNVVFERRVIYCDD